MWIERWILKCKSMNKDIRVGDAERHNALDLLSTHFANGLIDINEFEDRTGRRLLRVPAADRFPL